MEPHILFEDADILVISKPSGMTVNTADTNREELTVQKWVEGREGFTIQDLGLKNSSQKDPSRPSGTLPKEGNTTNISPPAEGEGGGYNIAEEFKNRGGIVHRLDKETSGVLVIAKNPESFGKLKEQFMTRTTEKVYLALAHGKITPPEGEINAPVGRLPFNRMHFGVIAGGREAVTRYRVISNFQFQISKDPSRPSGTLPKEGNTKLSSPPLEGEGGGFTFNKKYTGEVLSLVELYPKTGRTHQIRVHLKYINHPIVSDPLYAGRKVGREDRKMLSRLFLHAANLTFTHPTTGEKMTITAPLPVELKEFLKKLEKV